ncbi:MAG: hypothetical protein WAO55_15440 [Candidatus Manganitrophaceae bacterium]
MSAAVWWPLFPLLFFIVLTCLIAAFVRAERAGGISRSERITLSLALLFYFLTFALGRWRWLHMPMSNIAELLILYNLVHFARKGRKEIAWLNGVALLAIAADFALHYLLR